MNNEIRKDRELREFREFREFREERYHQLLIGRGLRPLGPLSATILMVLRS